jgi:MFS transporter, Spinster family, sphingosine-1-phosphate transporter
MSGRKLPYGLIAFLTLINILNYFDRYLVQALEPVLKGEFALTNQESGLLGAAFVVGYVFFSPLFGFFGDRIDRRILMAVGLVAWSLFTGLGGLASGFTLFLVARMLVGVGEASFAAIVPCYLKARIPDMVKLNSALSIFYVAIPVGSALGYIAGGQLAVAWGWRTLFMLATIPGLVLAFGFLFVSKESKGVSVAAAQPAFLPAIASIAKSSVLRLTILGYVLQTFALNGIAMFVVRHVANLGMPEDVAAKYFGINLAITGFVGALGGGQLASRLVAHSTTPVRGLLQFVGITTMMGVPFLSAALLLSAPWLFFALCFVAQIALFAGTAPLNSVLVARAPTGLEALTQGITIFAIQLFGSALAPVLIGWIADILISSTGIAEARALAIGLQLSSVAMVAAALVWLMAAKEEQRSGPAAA